MLYLLSIGSVLGLSAGFAPGPLLALVISETIQHDIKAGIKTAVAPILTDLPIILATLFLLNTLAYSQTILAIISFIGAFVLLLFGAKSMATKKEALQTEAKPAHSLKKGILVNALSPHPYVFWMSIGGPIMLKALQTGVPDMLAFVLPFYFFLVGSKVVIAVLTGKSSRFLTGNFYILVMRILGLMLCFYAIVLVRDGLQLLGIITAH